MKNGHSGEKQTHHIVMPVLSISKNKSSELSYAFTKPSIANRGSNLSLFGIFLIDSTLPVYQIFIEQTVKNFLDFYQRRPKDIEYQLASEALDGFEFIFENSLQYTYENLTDSLKEFHEANLKSVPIDIQKINFILGAIYDGTLFVCTQGKLIQAYLLYPKTMKGPLSSRSFTILDILENANSSIDDAPHRLFASVISGTVSIPRSKIIFCNRAFLDYVSIDQLKHTLTNQSIDNLIQHYQRILSKAQTNKDFIAIFIDPWCFDEKQGTGNSDTVAHNSVESLLEKQRGTSVILTYGLASNVISISLILYRFIFGTIKKIIFFFLQQARILQSSTKRENMMRRFNLTLARSKTAAQKNGRIVFTNAHTYIIQSLFPAILGFSRRCISFLLLFFNTKIRPLPPNSKALLIVCLLFSVLFIQSLISIAGQRSFKKSQLRQQELLAQIEQHMNVAESSMIYTHDAKAEQALSSAFAILQSIQQEKLGETKLGEQLGLLTDRYQSIKNKLSRVIDISLPKILVNLDENVPSASSMRFVGYTNPLLLISTDSIYAMNNKTGILRQINTQIKFKQSSCASPAPSSLIYICSEGNRLFLYQSRDKKLTSIPYGGSSQPVLTDIAVFNKRLYVLNGVSGIIMRHDRLGLGFGDGIPWIRDGSSLTNARQIAIDGNIYVLRNQADLDVYNAGKKTHSIKLPSLPIPISEITQLWTDDKTGYIFLVDSNEKRILVFDKKTYSYVVSITSPLFLQGIQDVIADASDILVIAGGKLIQFPIGEIQVTLTSR